MSALGQKQTFALHQAMSASPPRADIGSSNWNVRLVPEQRRAKPTFHLEFFGVIPVAASFFRMPIEPVLITWKW